MVGKSRTSNWEITLWVSQYPLLDYWTKNKTRGSMDYIAHLRTSFLYAINKLEHSYDYIDMLVRIKWSLSSFWGWNDPIFKQTWIHFTHGFFVLSQIQIGTLFLEKRFLKVVNIFLLFRNYVPLEKDVVLQLFPHY